jgi:hypothetical protein
MDNLARAISDFITANGGIIAVVGFTISVIAIVLNVDDRLRKLRIVDVHEGSYDEQTLTVSVKAYNPGKREVYVTGSLALVCAGWKKRAVHGRRMGQDIVFPGEVKEFKVHFDASPDEICRIWLKAPVGIKRRYRSRKWPLRSK